jgi:hypothetical protein
MFGPGQPKGFFNSLLEDSDVAVPSQKVLRVLPLITPSWSSPSGETLQKV